MDSIRAFINNYVALPPSDWAQIRPHFQQRTFAGGDWLLVEGRICRHLYFLESGILRFTYECNGEEATKFFTQAPYLCTAQRSLTQRIPAEEGIQAVTDSVVWLMPEKPAFELLKLTSWSEFVRKLVQEVQFDTERLFLESQARTAEERYQSLLQDEPDLVAQVPLKHLASFLGIAQPSLSRIRKKRLAPSNLT